ncbi:MAG: cytochrome c [Planctomycetaceae bacterium]
MGFSSRSLACVALIGLLSAAVAATRSQDAVKPPPSGDPKPIAPAKTTNTGLLLEPALDLPSFTREKFIQEMSTVGREKIWKPWTSPVVNLPPHARSDAHGLTEDEVRQYMITAKRLFDRGEAIPVSDVGLISTQEDVIRQPMLNHIAAFANSAVRVYLLVQRTASDNGWSYFSIVQDMTVDPPLDYYGQVFDTDVNFEGTSCYKCHSSGPLAIHPAREDLVLDSRLAAALSQYIADQPRSQFRFPEHSPRPPTGKPMTLGFCTACHDEDGDRAPLYQVHSHPIRVLVDFGYMPPGQPLTAEEIAELKAWLESTD